MGRVYLSARCVISHIQEGKLCSSICGYTITTDGTRVRCCFALGHHRDLMKEYEWNGTREIYFQIFLECFNVFLCTKTGKSSLICTSCVLRLRDATSFKKMVLEAERSLTSCKGGSVTDPVTPSSSTMLMVEIKCEPEDSSDSNGEKNDENSNDDSMHGQEQLDPSSMLIVEIKREGDAGFESNDAKQNDDSSQEQVKVKNSNPSTACRKKRPGTPGKVKDKNRKEKLAYIHNTRLIIENSNVAPFKPKYQNGVPCFYCSKIFQDISEMKQHQQMHTKTELKNILNTLGAEAFIIYVDVTDLKCTICNEEMPNLAELKSHFVKKHKKKVKDCPDRMVPFKLTPNVYQCQVCKGNFGTFGAMERHMNVHFRNYVCKECGTGYVTKSRFKVHSKQHNEGSFECETCKKVYTTALKLKKHVDLVHKMVKRLKCMKCGERFVNYFKQQKHMVEEHGEARLEYKCNFCDKIFDRKYLLSTHMKRDHLEERDFKCEICSYTCFAKNDLKYHMIKHNGSRIFECSLCDKSYARKKTLREHMRIHNDDRRYACQECGQAFVQNCSLKGHIKTHHPELQMP
ncbi:zinc finger protein 431-like isoform X1 [Maniola hyperantus]|uniref:zinc finger protein 431-like isoform X1 n=2 Tax=Aphantopus hyperantus TaxID=2795564 RepID=UPI0037484A81